MVSCRHPDKVLAALSS
ncbi:hypothetical protein [Mycolicibacterium sphagni]